MRLSKIDPNSYSNPEEAIIDHINLDWSVDFSKKILKGSASLNFKILKKSIEEIILDVYEINIAKISIVSSSGLTTCSFKISDHIVDIGSKLTIKLPSKAVEKLEILIEYQTSPAASALQWLTPEQTLGKKHPYLFSQGQPIHIRSILPCQDTSAVKFTYNAKLTYPEELTGLMSAIRTNIKPGYTEFEQTVPIPSCLIAIVVGNVVSKRLGPISSIWAEGEQLEEAAIEFSETDRILRIAEEVCGVPYLWKQYDVIVMPPSFPLGGMENPCLTFVTPTIISGDKTLAIDTIAHEVAHSWTGNLITNINFEHFWLNEGFTVYIHGLIILRMYNKEERDFLGISGLSELSDCINTQFADQPERTKLVIDLTDLGPDDVYSCVPYMKGSTYLRYLEEFLGGLEVFEPFLKFYLNKYKYKSISTDDFQNTLLEYFKDPKYNLISIDWNLWLYGTGMSPTIPKFDRSLVDAATSHAYLWIKSSIEIIRSSPLISEKLIPTQIVEILSQLLANNEIIDLNAKKIELLSKVYKIYESKNTDIRFTYLRVCIKAQLEEKINEIIEFVNSNFRMKLCRPIYRELGGWPTARQIAIENFEEKKNQMMKLTAYNIAKDLGI